MVNQPIRLPAIVLACSRQGQSVDFPPCRSLSLRAQMNVVKATRHFEEWVGSRTDLVKRDLRLKHASMKAGVFHFLRATYYRWAQIWPEVCSELAKGPQVLAIGDLHVENFGTWRDLEGRLIWGVNDFDEAYPCPTQMISSAWPSAPISQSKPDTCPSSAKTFVIRSLMDIARDCGRKACHLS